MSIEALEGRSYADRPYRICAEKSAEFVAVTGDDPDRWAKAAPPGMAAALLFVVAPDLLAEVEGPVIHGDQSFTWHRPLVLESDVSVTGTVDRVRSRGGVAFVTFSLAVSDSDGPLVDGRSTFLVGGTTDPVDERPEPPAEQRGEGCSASRADLVRYAAATRDWNPIHWDHHSGVEAGLGGIVAHGLLQSAWLTRAAATARASDRPLTSARFRYTAPLFPAQPAKIEGDTDGPAFELALVADGTPTLTAKFEAAS